MEIRIPEVQETNLNLIPIMNLFTALIPFLMLSAAFFHLAMIQVSVPVASSTGETDVAKEEDKITLTMRITPAAFELSAASDTIEPAKLRELEAKIPRAIGTPEEAEATYANLSAQVFRIKAGYSSSDTVMVVPDLDIPLREVVEAIDAVRETVREVEGRRSRVELFPRVVLSTMVRD